MWELRNPVGRIENWQTKHRTRKMSKKKRGKTSWLAIRGFALIGSTRLDVCTQVDIGYPGKSLVYVFPLSDRSYSRVFLSNHLTSFRSWQRRLLSRGIVLLSDRVYIAVRLVAVNNHAYSLYGMHISTFVSILTRNEHLEWLALSSFVVPFRIRCPLKFLTIL